MAGTIRGTLLRHLIITVVILANGQWSLCGSIDSNLESHTKDLERMGGATTAGFHLVGTDVSSNSLSTSDEGRRRLSLEQIVGINPIKPSKEVEILMGFKSEITGDPLGVLNSWRANDSDPCRWTGVGCSPNSKHVTIVNLEGLNLVGTVSTLLGQLLNLQYLDLSQNFLHGSIPASLGNCSSLLYLNMSFNELNADIPPLLGNLDRLQTLDLSFNYLGGEIPETLGNCSALQYLELSYNSFDGGIPSQLGSLSSLLLLDLANNSISGSVPPTLGNCSSLFELWLPHNQRLGGELPFELGELTQMVYFGVSFCSFQGSFPMWTLNLTSLQYLGVSANQFTGQLPQSWRQLPNLSLLLLSENPWDESQIPRDIGALTNLAILDLQNCFLAGEIPKSLFNITSLQYLNLGLNQLTGPISDDIGGLVNLTYLYAGHNAFSGVLPSSLSNCSLLEKIGFGNNPGFDPQGFPSWIASFQNMQEIDFQEMNLQGEIPTEIGQLSQLGTFLIWNNNFSGAIPGSLGNCTFLFDLEVNSNHLTGQVPPDLGHLSQLTYLDIADNSFSPGPFPAFIFNLTSSLSTIQIDDNKFNGKLDGDFGAFQLLQAFSVENNQFQGQIPESLSNCSNLYVLQLGRNTLTGEIPLGLANLTSLQTLDLGHNQLHGSIHGLLTNFHLMEILDFSMNNLNGTIPVEIGQLIYLQGLHMSANKFIGALPDSLNNCTELLNLDFSQNSLTSSIPGEAFGKMLLLKTLDLSGNLFSGSWPSQFSGLKQIVSINVSANNMSGPIPLGLGGCFLLESLDLSFNTFSGPIPQDLGLLKDLTTFNASYNNFSGPIPNSGAFQANLTSDSFLGNPGLCGGPLGPQRLCPVEIIGSPTRRSHCHGFECPIVWISVVSGLGFVIILLGALYISSHYYGKRDSGGGSGGLGLVTFTTDPSVRFTKLDILAALGAGENATIGRGRNSIVYKANLPGGEFIAIKVLKDRGPPNIEGQREDAKEILSEAHTLAQLRHRNIINVVGLYSSEDIKAILLEYMPKGSLHENLHGNAPCELTWAERFKILLGVTNGMVYLHHEFPEPIIHRDLKPSNILLDADLEPKLCDFGVSKFVTYNSGDNGEVSASTNCGTFGYMAPEYGTGTRVSTKGDVYSFGVVLLELLTAKAVIQTESMAHSGQDHGLVGIVQRTFQESNITPGVTPLDLLEPTLNNESASDAIMRQQMMLTLQLGLFCTRVLPENRPSMNIVLEFLVQIEKIGQGAVIERTLDDLLKEDSNDVVSSS